MTLPADVLKSAEDCAELAVIVLPEPVLGDWKAVARAAAEGAVAACKKRMLADMAETARQYARDTPDNAFANAGAAKAGILWLADRIGEGTSPTAPGEIYEPRDGDVVQVSVSGEVYTEIESCESCGEVQSATWTVVTESGDEYEFPVGEMGSLEVRVITTSRETGV